MPFLSQIHEASLAVSLCTSVCRNLPGVLEHVSGTSLAKGVANAAEKTLNGPPLSSEEGEEAKPFSHAMYNLLVACLAIADIGEEAQSFYSLTGACLCWNRPCSVQ